MQSQCRHDHRSPVPIVSGIVDVLQAERRINSPPNMERVIRLDDVLAPVIKAAIAEKKTGATEREVFLMIARDAVRNECHTSAIEFSMPPLAVAAGADLRRLIHLRIGKRLMPALIPSPPAEYPHPVIQRLLETHAESVFDRCLQRMSRDIRLGRYPREEIVDGLAVTPHVGVIHKTQETDNSFLMPKHCAVDFEFNIFCTGASYVRIEVNAVGHFRHQRFRKSHCPAPLA